MVQFNEEIQVEWSLQQSARSSKERSQPQKEKLDYLIVLGQGPVKPVLLFKELSSEEITQWEIFKKDPLRGKEPAFRVIEGESYLRELEEIGRRTDIGDSEKNQLIEQKRQEWQHMGRFGLNRWGRQNALAAGLALYAGVTDKIILSGGKTIPKSAKDGPHALPLERLENWPSEAELMRDIIVRRFGRLLFEKEYSNARLHADYLLKFSQLADDSSDRYAGFVREKYQSFVTHELLPKLLIEADSTNTLENFAYTINHHPDLIDKKNQIGIIAADFHLRRSILLSHLFSIIESPGGGKSAQELLRQRAASRNKTNYESMLLFMKDALNNPDLRDRLTGEERWERGLIDENFLGYWIGYFADVADVTIVQNILISLRDSRWVQHARGEFTRAGLDFDELSETDLKNLAAQQPEKFQELREKLRLFKGPLRTVPPS